MDYDALYYEKSREPVSKHEMIQCMQAMRALTFALVTATTSALKGEADKRDEWLAKFREQDEKLNAMLFEMAPWGPEP